MDDASSAGDWMILAKGGWKVRGVAGRASIASLARSAHVAITLMLVTALLGGGCTFYTRTTPEEVRQAIAKAGILGSTPEEAIKRLRQVHLASGQELRVGPFTPDFNVVEATVDNARRTIMTRWSVDVLVTFDSTTHRASHIDVRYSAVNPM